MAKTDTRPDLGQMQPLAEAGFDLIPLHRWDSIRINRGKTRQMGKAPRNKHWTTATVDCAATRWDAARDGSNVGVRLKADQLVVDIDPRSIEGGVANDKRLKRVLDKPKRQ